MNKNYIIVGNRNYIINVDAVMKWCLSSKDNPVKECEITEGYDMEDAGNVGSKVVRELKSPNTQDDTIRYDFIKQLFTPLLTSVASISEIEEDLSLRLMFNTLVNMGFITEITD